MKLLGVILLHKIPWRRSLTLFIATLLKKIALIPSLEQPKKRKFKESKLLFQSKTHVFEVQLHCRTQPDS